MSNTSFTTIKVPDFVFDLNIYPFPVGKKIFSSGDYIRNLRERIWNRYRKDIESALDNLAKKPKKEWPKLLKNF